MDRLKHYRQIIQEILMEYHQLNKKSGSTTESAIGVRVANPLVSPKGWLVRKVGAIALCLSSFRPTGDRTSIFTLLYDRALTWANFLGTISSWKNIPAYRLCTYHFRNIDYTDWVTLKRRLKAWRTQIDTKDWIISRQFLHLAIED